MEQQEKRKFVSKRVIGNIPKVYRTWADWKTGDIVLGTYIAKHEDNYDNVCPVIKVEEAWFTDKKLAKDLVGKNLVLNSCGSLDKAMKEATFGEIIQLEYKGKNLMEGGKYAGKEAHSVEVQIMEESSEEEVDFYLPDP